MEIYKFLKENSARIHAPFSFIIRIALIITIAYAIYFHLWRILFINLLLLVLVFIPVLSKKINVEIPKEIDFIILVFIVISFFLGGIRGLVIQIFFGITLGFVGFALIMILYRNSVLKPNYLLVMLFSLSISLALGTISELSKFFLKLILNSDIAVGDYVFSMVSLSMVFIGALFSSVVGYTYMKGSKTGLMGRFVKRFKKKNPNLFIEKTDSPDEILELIKKGENEKLEFKSTLRTNIHTNEHDKRVELSVLKTIAALLNTEGGTLLIGVTDEGKICGIEKDHFQTNDKFNLHFTNLIKEHIGNNNLLYCHFELVLIEGKHILKVECRKSSKPVFLTFHKVEEFYMRAGAATVQVTGSRLVDYINNSFKI